MLSKHYTYEALVKGRIQEYHEAFNKQIALLSKTSQVSKEISKTAGFVSAIGYTGTVYLVNQDLSGPALCAFAAGSALAIVSGIQYLSSIKQKKSSDLLTSKYQNKAHFIDYMKKVFDEADCRFIGNAKTFQRGNLPALHLQQWREARSKCEEVVKHEVSKIKPR